MSSVESWLTVTRSHIIYTIPEEEPDSLQNEALQLAIKLLEKKVKHFEEIEKENKILKTQRNELEKELHFANEQNHELKELLEFTELEKHCEVEELIKKNTLLKQKLAAPKKKHIAARFGRWCRKHLFCV